MTLSPWGSHVTQSGNLLLAPHSSHAAPHHTSTRWLEEKDSFKEKHRLKIYFYDHPILFGAVIYLFICQERPTHFGCRLVSVCLPLQIKLTFRCPLGLLFSPSFLIQPISSLFFWQRSLCPHSLIFCVGMRSKQSKINYEKPSFRRMARMRTRASSIFSHA